jgi:hypothetical protein
MLKKIKNIFSEIFFTEENPWIQLFKEIKSRKDWKRTIFVVTTMTIKDPNSEKFFDNRSRPVGWFPTFESAEIEVLNNSCDINECDPNGYVVIEECHPGFYDVDQIETWYKWNDKLEKYERCEKPKCFSSTCNFGLG